MWSIPILALLFKYNLKGSPLLTLLCSLSIRFVGKASHAAALPCCCTCQCCCVSVVVHMLLCSLSIRFVGKASHAAGLPCCCTCQCCCISVVVHMLLCSLSIRFVGKASHAAGLPCCCTCQCCCVSVVVRMLLCSLSIRFVGKASHAAGFQWQGVNALDAAVVCYTSISCLRQQLKPTWRVHGQPPRHASLNTAGRLASPRLRFNKVTPTISMSNSSQNSTAKILRCSAVFAINYYFLRGIIYNVNHTYSITIPNMNSTDP